MISPGSAPWWRQLLRAALQSAPAPADGHVTDDDELIACWAGGLLSTEEERDLLEHLDSCADCRREVMRLIDDGLFEQPPAKLAARPNRLRWVGLMAAGLAALLLLTVGGGALLWMRGHNNRPQDAELAAAEDDLGSGRAEAALGRVETWLEGEHPAADRERALALLERAGYAVAQADLKDGRFKEARDLAERLGGRVASARLRNLALQAEQDQPVEVALARTGTLLGYGFQMDGFMAGKDLPVIDEPRDRAWQEALKDFPEEPLLLVNYGQFLMTQGQFGDARDRFAAALKADAGLAEAHLGLGLAAFASDKDEAALKEFEEFIGLRPENPDGYVNAAVCLERMKRARESWPHWRRAWELSKDAALRGRIERHLERIGAPPPG